MSGRNLAADVAKLAMAAVVLIELVDEARFARRRLRLATSRWWMDVERREQRELHWAEIAALRRLRRS